MERITRRTVLQQGSLGALTAATLPSEGWVRADTPARKPERPVPRDIRIDGFHAYASAPSVCAGDGIQFHLSSTLPYQFSIVRLGSTIDHPERDEVLHRFEPVVPVSHPIRPGSCIWIEKGLARDDVTHGLAWECWIRLFKVDTRQGIVSQGSSSTRVDGMPIRLIVTGQGAIEFTCGRVINGGKLQPMTWHHVVAQWDGTQVAIWLDGRCVAQEASQNQQLAAIEGLILGGIETDGVIDHFMEGDLAMPTLYNRALGEQEISLRYKQRGLQPAVGIDVLACWPLQEERGTRVADVSSHARHGTIINHATWMVGGPSFDAQRVPRFDTKYDPNADPKRGHAIRFASDDLYDCQWPVTYEYRIPVEAKSGVYCGRAHFEVQGKSLLYHVTFVVKKASQAAPAPLLVLCSSNTWLAYNSTPFAVNQAQGLSWGTGGMPNSHPQAPAYSCYRDHHSGQPTYQLGLRMPWPVAGPDVLYSSAEMGYSHLMRGERFTHIWLDENGYEYDVITDLDLHRDPDQLKQYRAVLINGHSEYWTVEAYQGLDQYLCEGGNAMVFSGNTMFWRVTFSPDGSMMECRKYDEAIGGRHAAALGELYHSHDGKRGSLLRECGFPAWQVVGLECDGWGGITEGEFGIYRVETPDHFLFHQPENVELTPESTFGHGPNGHRPRAVGHEWDVRVSRLTGITANVPTGAGLPQEPEGIVTLARGVREQKSALDYFTRPTTAPDGTICELIYWERPQGGKVFHSGAIATGWAMSVDPVLQKLTRNVLHHFNVHPTRPASS